MVKCGPFQDQYLHPIQATASLGQNLISKLANTLYYQH